MTENGFDLTATGEWTYLCQQAQRADTFSIRDLLGDGSERESRYSLSAAGIFLDYSKNLLTDGVLDALVRLAECSPLAERREAMFKGEPINITEQRPVLHTALRAAPQTLEQAGLGDLARDIDRQKQRMRVVSDKIRNGEWLGATGLAITDIVNLGIGGSDLGPRMACESLKEYAHPRLRCHFVSNVDGEVIRSTLSALNPETTLVVISSKTFTTQETLLNARTAAQWFRDALGLKNPFNSPHFLGVTASPEVAESLGIPKDNLLQFWDWVGGRYSLWSTIGLSIAISCGYDNFEALLCGARAMDEHFYSAPAGRNMPVILALLGVWYSNLLKAESQAVIPYCERLMQLPFYLQQLDMESNGKLVSLNNQAVGYSTGPIIWGLTGTNGQHSFFQLLHQGTHLVPVDFIGLVRDDLSQRDHHRVLMANMLAQSAALMSGKRDPQLPAYRQYPGNRPSNVLLLDTLTPASLGALLALYEHKVFVQGCLWNLNSFDQWGVELGKTVAGELLGDGRDKMDDSTQALLGKFGDLFSASKET